MPARVHLSTRQRQLTTTEAEEVGQKEAPRRALKSVRRSFLQQRALINYHSHYRSLLFLLAR
jgi:hypothetical protein